MQASAPCSHTIIKVIPQDLLLEKVHGLQPSSISLTDAEIQEIYHTIDWESLSRNKCLSCMSGEELMRGIKRKYCLLLTNQLLTHSQRLTRSEWKSLDRCRERLQKLTSDDEKMTDPYIRKYLGGSGSGYVFRNLMELKRKVKSMTILQCLQLRDVIHGDLNNDLNPQAKEILQEVLDDISEQMERFLGYKCFKKFDITPQIYEGRSINEIVEIVTEKFYAFITSSDWTSRCSVLDYLQLGVDLTKRQFVHFAVKNMKAKIACDFIEKLIHAKKIPQNVDDVDEEDKTVLDHAIDKGYYGIVEMLKDHAKKVNPQRYQLYLARRINECSYLIDMERLIKRALDIETPLDLSSIYVTSGLRKISLLSYACNDLTSRIYSGHWSYTIGYVYYRNRQAWRVHAEFASGVLDLTEPNEENQAVRDDALYRSLSCYKKDFYVSDETCTLTYKLLEKNASVEGCLNEACFAIEVLLPHRHKLIFEKKVLDSLLLSLVTKTIQKQNELAAKNKKVFPLLVYLLFVQKLDPRFVIDFINWAVEQQIPIDYNQTGTSRVQGKLSPLDAAIFGGSYGANAKDFPLFLQLISALCKNGATTLYHPNRYRSFLGDYLQTASNCTEMYLVIENLLHFFREVNANPQLVLPLTELKIGKNTVHNLLTWTLRQIKAEDNDAERFCTFLSEQPEFQQEANSKPFVKDQFIRAKALLSPDTSIN